MSAIFSSNPIVIKKANTTIGIIEMDFDYEEKSFILVIEDISKNVLYKGQPDSETFISIDVSAISITLTYQDADNGEVLRTKTINLVSKFDVSQEEVQIKNKVISDGNIYTEIMNAVKEDMDDPQGTPKEVEHHTLMLNKATMSDKARAYVENKIKQIISRWSGLSESTINEYTNKIYANFYGMGILQELDDNDDVGEILVNGFIYPYFHCDVYYYLKGEKIKYDKTFESLDDLLNVYSRAIAFSKKELNNVENALIEATRANRDRVNIIIPDAAESYVLNIRKFGNFVPNLNSMKEYGTVDSFIDRLMNVFVKGKANIGIGGEMGTGKTTFINYLLTYTQPLERKVVIASASETDVERVLKGHDVVILNVDETKGFTFSKLIRASLRTTASRVIIPESRGDEFKQVYEANLKTKGNMFTAHALADYEFLDMCVDMYNGDNSNFDMDNIKNKIAKSVDIIIIMRKVGNNIRIKSISEVVFDEKKNFKEMNLLYYWESDPEDVTKGQYKATGNKITPNFKTRLNEYGVPMSDMIDL